MRIIVGLQCNNRDHLVGGWWFQPTPLKKMNEFVNWDDDILHVWKNKSHVPVTTNQVDVEAVKGC